MKVSEKGFSFLGSLSAKSKVLLTVLLIALGTNDRVGKREENSSLCCIYWIWVTIQYEKRIPRF